MGVTRTPGVAQQVKRVGQQRVFRRSRVGGARDKGGIGAILDQPAHQIGQQVAMRPNRRVDPATNARLRPQSLVQRFAHAMQALEFIILPLACAQNNGGGGEGVMGGELRKKRRRRKQGVGAGEIIEVGHGFARENRVIGQPALLRALDLAIPIGALDQPHHETAFVPPRQRRDMVDHRQRPLLIGLHRQTQTVPIAQGRVGGDAAEQVQRQFQPVGLFRIHSQSQIGMFRQSRQFEQTGRQLLAHTLGGNRLVARMQRRKFYGKSGPFGGRCALRGKRDGADRHGIGVEMLFRVVCRARAFAEHVVGIEILAVGAVFRSGQCGLDGFSEYKMAAEQRHRSPRGGAQHRSAEAPRQIGGVFWGGKLRPDEFCGKAEREGAGLHQRRVGGGLVMGEVAGSQFVGKQEIGGGIVGRADKSLGQSHDRQAFARRELEFVQKILDAAQTCAELTSHRAQKFARQRPRRLALAAIWRLTHEILEEILVRRRIGRRENVRFALFTHPGHPRNAFTRC